MRGMFFNNVDALVKDWGIQTALQACNSNIPLWIGIRGWKDLGDRSVRTSETLRSPSCRTRLRVCWESLLIQLHHLFHLGSNQILWKDFGFSCWSHWRLLTASYPEFPQTAAGWRRVIQARFAIRPLTPPLQTLPRTAHHPRSHAWKTLGRLQQKGTKI